MQLDSRGLEITTASADAVRHLDAAVADYLDYGQTASAEVKAALNADPDCALAQCYRGYLLMMLENRAVLPKVQQALDALAGMADDLTPRERLHAEALQAWVKGDLINACLAWEAILNDWPRDVMALKLHHTMAFYTGRAHVLRSVVSGVLGEWDDTIPNYANVQGMYAYALEECGDYAEAERWGREATDRNPGDLWAIHSVAHVLEMQGRASEGAKWLDQPPERWANKNFFKAHVWWHGALFHFAQENFDEVFRIFDEVLTTVNSDKYVDVSNQAALLKRLEIAGLDVGDRWDALAEHSQTRIHDHILPFRDAHFCLSLAAKKRFDVAREHIDSMAVFAREGEGWTSHTTQSLLIPLCEAIIAYEAGEYGKACDLIWPIRNELSPIGGSLAQRDLFAQILIDSAVRGKRLGMARALLSERVAKFPGARRNWAEFAKVLDDLGETDRAAHARLRMQTASHVSI
ncbi:MAG: tetratricopeptide repeat protein [Rhodobiaceae bacterium]|nr:tetratricopeptide repeat protein [Rhodobiaceae bacterium]MCC0041378.1 tetratricopeptide repeat protein [Rhodobiaceae bacterium]